MRVSKFALAAVTILAVASLMFFAVPGLAEAVPLGLPDLTGGHHHALLADAGAALAALRAKVGDLETRAAAKLAEVKDGLTPEQVRAIEADHAVLVTEITETRGQITEQERAAGAAGSNSVTVERQRSAEISTLASRHAMPAGFAQQHITAGTTIDQVRTLVLDEVAKRADANRVSPRSEVISDEGDKIRAAVENAIVHRASPSAIKLDDAARSWRGMSLLEMGREFTEETTGVKLRGLSKRELASVLLGLEKRVGMMSTSDFPNILANVASKRLRAAYDAAPQSWKMISRQSNAPDFKEKAVVQLSNLPIFKQVKEGAEFQYAGLSEGVEKYALATYGRIVPITRQTLINDDLGAFDRMPTMLGRAAAETEASIFWALITSNAVMSDGNGLFHASHGNLAGAGSAISIDSLSAGRAAMRKQKGFAAKAADREALNIAPKYLIVSPDKETEAQQFLASVIAGQATAVNPFAGSLTQITEARLTGTAWYLVADPSVIDTIEYAYLEGEEGLYTETRIGFEVDGIEVKGRLDFAAKPIEWRSLYKNPGA